MAKKTNEIIRYQAVTYGMLELREQEVVLVYENDITDEQKEIALQEATYYVALANRPVKLTIDEESYMQPKD